MVIVNLRDFILVHYFWCYALEISTDPCVIMTQAEPGKQNYIAKVVELFEADDGESYFRARWFYRPEDTVRCFLRFENLLRFFCTNVYCSC